VVLMCIDYLFMYCDHKLHCDEYVYVPSCVYRPLTPGGIKPNCMERRVGVGLSVCEGQKLPWVCTIQWSKAAAYCRYVR